MSTAIQWRPGSISGSACSDQIYNAVEYAHGRLVVHHDLKPSNILGEATGMVK